MSSPGASAVAAALVHESGARAQDVFDRGHVEAASGEQDVQVIDEVRRFLDNAFVALVERGDGDLDRFLPHLARARADALVEQLCGVGACGALGRARGDRSPELRREAGDAPGVARGACRPDADEQRVAVAVVAHLVDRKRVAGGLALPPQALTRAAPEPRFAGLTRS